MSFLAMPPFALYIGGASTCCGITNQVLAMDLKQRAWQLVFQMKPYTIRHSCATLSNKVYVVGPAKDPGVDILTVDGDIYSVTFGPDLPGHVLTYMEKLLLLKESSTF